MTMPSVVDGGANGSNNPTSITLSSFVVATSQPDDILVAVTSMADPSTDDTVSVVLDPGGGSESSFTEEAAAKVVNSGSPNVTIQFWYLINPPTGTFDITATGGGANINRYIIGVLHIKDAHQTDPIGAVGTASGSSATPNVDTTTTVANSLVLGNFSIYGFTTASPGTGDTEVIEYNQSSAGLYVASTPAATTGTYNVLENNDYGSAAYASCGIEILEAAGAPPATAYMTPNRGYWGVP